MLYHNLIWDFDGTLMDTYPVTFVSYLQRALQDLGRDFPGQTVTILGAGGAARSVAMTAVDSGARQVRVVNRTPEKAEVLCAGEPSMQAFSVERVGHEIRFTVTGNGFLHNMVRILVGTLIEVGRGERTAESIAELFSAKRADTGELLPACGLCLMEVTY